MDRDTRGTRAIPIARVMIDTRRDVNGATRCGPLGELLDLDPYLIPGDHIRDHGTGYAGRCGASCGFGLGDEVSSFNH
jgi:hypothetical protein